MRDRAELSAILNTIRDNVYYQPDSNTKMTYPCIEYSFEGESVHPANNDEYIVYGRYSVIDIYKSPGKKKYSEIKKALKPFVSYSNNYIADGLHHDVYTVYF